MLGYRADPPKPHGEEPDWAAEELLGTAPVPAAASARQLVLSVLNQGRMNSCVANAGLQAVRASHVRQGAKEPALGSRLFAYYMSRAAHSEVAVDGGTYLRTFFDCLNKFGFPPESAYPYVDDGSTFARMPSTSAVRAAFDQRNPTVYRKIVSEGVDRIEHIKRAVAAGHLVCFGTEVSREFVQGVDFGGLTPLLPPLALPIAGGHAMAVAAYAGDRFEVVNSWGRAWGDDGWAYFSADYLAWEGSRDFWIVEHAPQFTG